MTLSFSLKYKQKILLSACTQQSCKFLFICRAAVCVSVFLVLLWLLKNVFFLIFRSSTVLAFIKRRHTAQPCINNGTGPSTAEVVASTTPLKSKELHHGWVWPLAQVMEGFNMTIFSNASAVWGSQVWVCFLVEYCILFQTKELNFCSMGWMGFLLVEYFWSFCSHLICCEC